jgi:hypothetical protein
MRQHVICMLMMLSLPATAFAQPMKIDGSSKENYEASIKAMADSLSAENKEIFSKGLINLILTRYPPAIGAEGLTLLQFIQPAVEAAHIHMNGVTVEEIMARGRQLALGQSTSKPEHTEQDETLECLKQKVVIESTRLRKGDFGFSATYRITNNLSYAIGGIWLAYEVRSEGRSVPWAKEDFVTAIAGGIEPGETRELSYSLSLLSSSTPEDATVSFQVMDVADAESRLVLKTRGVIGWPDQKSPHGC